jgi:hypothetical protein
VLFVPSDKVDIVRVPAMIYPYELITIRFAIEEF